MMAKSNLLLLNESEQRLTLFAKAPLYVWEKAEYSFLPKRRTVTEYFCKFKQPLVGAQIELDPIVVDLLYGEISLIRCSGIDIGFCLKLASQLSTTILAESLMIKTKISHSSGKDIDIQLSLPQLQVIVRDNSTMFVIVKNPSLVGLE